MTLRKPKIAVLSDIHLGTFGCRAKELLDYLRSIQPETLILNGDIIDAWQFREKRFKKEHLAVVQRIIDLMLNGTSVIYLAGNHDEFLRRFIPLDFPNFKIANKVVLDIDGKKTWIFHGDVFDNSVNCSKWVAKLGGKGYDALIWFNYQVNQGLSSLGLPKRSISKKIKESVKGAVKYIGDFEEIAAEIAINEQYDTVICGHIHVPQDRIIPMGNKSVRYLNSGDWIENLTALEYTNDDWSLYKYKPINHLEDLSSLDKKEINLSMEHILT